MSETIDMGMYILWKIKQGSERWKKLRGRVTGSIVSAAVGHSRFKTTDAVAADIISTSCGGRLNHERNADMERGVALEPIARNKYMELTGNVVEEVGFAVPHWDNWIGYSPDGIIGEKGMIEIKCPRKIPDKMRTHRSWIEVNKWKIPKFYTEHIWQEHVDQMHLGMAIMNREWCDYVVYCEGEILIERVYFNKEYWEKLYGEIKKFIQERLKGRMREPEIY